MESYVYTKPAASVKENNHELFAGICSIRLYLSKRYHNAANKYHNSWKLFLYAEFGLTNGSVGCYTIALNIINIQSVSLPCARFEHRIALQTSKHV